MQQGFKDCRILADAPRGGRWRSCRRECIPPRRKVLFDPLLEPPERRAAPPSLSAAGCDRLLPPSYNSFTNGQLEQPTAAASPRASPEAAGFDSSVCWAHPGASWPGMEVCGSPQASDPAPRGLSSPFSHLTQALSRPLQAALGAINVATEPSQVPAAPAGAPLAAAAASGARAGPPCGPVAPRVARSGVSRADMCRCVSEGVCMSPGHPLRSFGWAGPGPVVVLAHAGTYERAGAASWWPCACPERDHVAKRPKIVVRCE